MKSTAPVLMVCCSSVLALLLGCSNTTYTQAAEPKGQAGTSAALAHNGGTASNSAAASGGASSAVSGGTSNLAPGTSLAAGGVVATSTSASGGNTGLGGLAGASTVIAGGAVFASSTTLTALGGAAPTQHAGAAGVPNSFECGNRVVEPGESCDEGDENGRYVGDGSGCSRACTLERSCRVNGITRACLPICGDGDRDVDEACDDGNRRSGDGCSADCQIESGYTCDDESSPMEQPCPDDPSKTCLNLPITYRDFDATHVSSGHPDFFFLGEKGPDGTPMVCVPNAIGVTDASSSMCSDDSTSLCSQLVQSELGLDGKPLLNTQRSGGPTCDCRFTDWNQTGVLMSAKPTTCNVGGDGSSRERVGYPTALKVRVIKDANSFNQWYNDSEHSTRVAGSLAFAATSDGRFQFNSSIPNAPAGAASRTVYDDIHAIFMGTETTLVSGFFPLEHLNRARVCNLWPYWQDGLDIEANCVAAQGKAVSSQWDPEGSYQRGVAGDGGPVAPVKGLLRNFHFTSELRHLFRYVGGETIEFEGDDDVWIFVNGKLVLDLGATHAPMWGKVTLNATADTTLKVGDRNVAQTSSALGLEVGRTYEIAVFHADRMPRESNYSLTLPKPGWIRSRCSVR